MTKVPFVLFLFSVSLRPKLGFNEKKGELIMKSQYRMLIAFITLLLAVSLACNGGNSTPVVPTSAPTSTKSPAQPQPPSNNPSNPPSGNNGSTNANSGSSDLVTFTDENGFLEFDLPGDWFYEQYTEEDLYIDIFTSPNELAIIESLVFDNNGGVVNNGGAALYLLNYRYSNTGKEGDIRVSSDQLEEDGSERLEWKSKSGNYSGVSWFELRGNNKSIFLMYTMYWSDDIDDATFDVLQQAVDSYRVP